MSSPSPSEECKALLDALGKAAACHRHLALSLGGASDSQSLRRELRQVRRKALELAAAARPRLTAALRSSRASPGAPSSPERAELERLWVLFGSCLETLEGDLRRALELSRAFPLRLPRRPLIQTGLSGGTAGVAARALSLRSLKDDGGGDPDGEEELKALENELNQVGEMLFDMEMKVSVPRWTVEAKKEPGAELASTASVGASSLGAFEADGGGTGGGGGKGFCDVSRVLAGILFAAALLVAVILAVCVAKLA